MTAKTSAQAPPPCASFLGIPVELRLAIYESACLAIKTKKQCVTGTLCDIPRQRSKSTVLTDPRSVRQTYVTIRLELASCLLPINEVNFIFADLTKEMAYWIHGFGESRVPEMSRVVISSRDKCVAETNVELHRIRGDRSLLEQHNECRSLMVPSVCAQANCPDIYREKIYVDRCVGVGQQGFSKHWPCKC